MYDFRNTLTEFSMHQTFQCFDTVNTFQIEIHGSVAGLVEAAIYWSGLNQLPLEMHAKHFLGHLGYTSPLEKVEAAALRLYLGVISNRNLIFISYLLTALLEYFNF